MNKITPVLLAGAGIIGYSLYRYITKPSSEIIESGGGTGGGSPPNAPPPATKKQQTTVTETVQPETNQPNITYNIPDFPPVSYQDQAIDLTPPEDFFKFDQMEETPPQDIIDDPVNFKTNKSKKQKKKKKVYETTPAPNYKEDTSYSHTLVQKFTQGGKKKLTPEGAELISRMKKIGM